MKCDNCQREIYTLYGVYCGSCLRKRAHQAFSEAQARILETGLELANSQFSLTNEQLLKELAQRIVLGKLELDKPQDWIVKGENPEEIVKHLKEKMGLCNKDGYALTNISDIYDRETNPNPLNLNYFIAKFKEELKEVPHA
ncbi:MAG: hypothetical protein MRERV_49c014 [Mycoplasmataceae bacterium RV_VA103A]|nr:MAG: hypothetical protein MRERV_49c014 [Mycoplasmataceae bacterium RV_VA103A]